MRSLADLSHIRRPLAGGGHVLVIDRGEIIKPEAQAMIMARFSRSTKDCEVLIDEMFDRDVGKFLRENYVVGYGHKSIGELGDCAIAIHGCSMLAAKAIQDFPLYRGQESSTRYIDFAKQLFLNPTNTSAGIEILESWRAFYLEGMAALIPELLTRFPRKEGEDEAAYRKAIKARAFDIMRAFLPAGATTNVAWAGDLRHVNDHLATLRNHPLPEMRGIARSIEDALFAQYPDSFDPQKRYPETEAYLEKISYQYGYFCPDEFPDDFRFARNLLDYELLREYREALENVPKKTELPFAIRECGSLRFEYLLDFGSFRDLQRQRALITRMPLLTGNFGFEQWYIDELPEALVQKAYDLIDMQIGRIESLGPDEFESQYYLPMGMRCPIRMTGDLRGLSYLVELRANPNVHPTLHRRSIQIADTMLEELRSCGLTLYFDRDPGRFDVKRGTHDIVEKI